MLATSNLSFAGANGLVLSCLSSNLPDLFGLAFEEMEMPAADSHVGVHKSHHTYQHPLDLLLIF